MQHSKRNNDINRLNCSKKQFNKNNHKQPQSKDKLSSQKSSLKSNTSKKPINTIKPTPQKPTPKVVNKPIQKTPENNHSIKQPLINQSSNQINELKSNLNLINKNISSENGNILTGKLTANEIFIKNDQETINVKDYINSLTETSNDIIVDSINEKPKTPNIILSEEGDISAQSLNILNDSTFNGKITIKNKNKEIELNPEKSSILCENGFVKNVDENNNNSVINVKYLKKYMNVKNDNDFYYAYLIKTDIYPNNYNDGDYILHYQSNKNNVNYVLKQVRMNDNNIKEVIECKNVKEGSICNTYDTEIKMYVYVNTNETLNWKQFINNSIDNLTINKTLTLNNNKINKILTGDNNNDTIPTVGYLENNYIKNTNILTLDKINLPVRVSDNNKNNENITINYITATNIDKKNQSIPTTEYINCNYAKKSDIPDLSNCLKKGDIPMIITRNDTLTKASDKNVYSSNKIDSLLNNTMQKISNLSITFNINWKDSVIRECEYTLSSVSGTIITLNKITNDKDVFEENLINIPSLEINLDEIKDIENNSISSGNSVNISIKEISVLSSDNSVSATYYISKNKPTTITIKDNDNNTYKTEFVSIIVENNKGQLVFNNNKSNKLYHKTITINMDNIYVCSRPSD